MKASAFFAALSIMAMFLPLEHASAQAAGKFVIPAWRGTDAGFAYWDDFQGNDSGVNYRFRNPPALAGGLDAAGHASSLSVEAAWLEQTGTPTAFITGSGAIYSFSAPTAFEASYQAPTTAKGEVTNVIFQTQTGGRRFDINNITLEVTTPAGGQALRPIFKAIDDPQTGAFAERLVSAFQWNLTGLGARDFRLMFSAPGSSMPLYQAQLDVVHGTPFVQTLGFLFLPQVGPALRFGRAGRIDKDLPANAETRFHLPGEMVPLLATPADGFIHVGWEFAGQVSETKSLSVTFGKEDLTAKALFSAKSYAKWRAHIFFHANATLDQTDEATDDNVSGPMADPDGDGLANLAEYAFATDPYTPDAHQAAPRLGPDGALRFVGQGSAAIADTSELAYEIFLSRDLATWRRAGEDGLPAATPLPSTLRADGTREFAYGFPLSENKLFFRVQATLSPP